ncbi:MAG: hypothetical protein ACREAM_04895 [Blastocatellia bacterium]
MKTIKHFIAMLLCISLCVSLTQAQPAPDERQDAQTTKPIAQDVLIIIQQEQVRFTARSSVAEMRLQIFDQSGQLAYDSGAVTEPELTWVVRQANGETIKSGLYAYTLSVKEAGAADARVRRGHFIVDRAKDRDSQTDRLWITSQNEGGVGTELTVARNEGETIAGASVTSERRSVTAERVAARDGEAESKDENNATVVAAAANGTTGRIAKFTSSTDLGNSVMTELNGNIGVGITNPLSKFHILSGANDTLPPRLQSSGATSFAAGWDFYHGATGKGYVGVPGSATGIAPGEMLVYGSPGTKTSLWAGGVSVATLDINANFGIGTASPQQKLHVNGNVLSTGSVAGFMFRNRGSASNTDDWIWYSEGNIARLYRANVGDLMTIAPSGLIGVKELQVTGGADFAENFDVNVAPAGNEELTPKVEAGMVVSLDPASPGKLQLSARAYDRRVAGIISGAGGVKPGMVMSQEGTLADGKYPVALSGRVYCWVDASQGAIEPGDLLTTSATPGHAMKATDAAKAHGAIIGKAMTSLKEGKGLALVLVSLQ